MHLGIADHNKWLLLFGLTRNGDVMSGDGQRLTHAQAHGSADSNFLLQVVRRNALIDRLQCAKVQREHDSRQQQNTGAQSN